MSQSLLPCWSWRLQYNLPRPISWRVLLPRPEVIVERLEGVSEGFVLRLKMSRRPKNFPWGLNLMWDYKSFMKKVHIDQKNLFNNLYKNIPKCNLHKQCTSILSFNILECIFVTITHRAQFHCPWGENTWSSSNCCLYAEGNFLISQCLILLNWTIGHDLTNSKN